MPLHQHDSFIRTTTTTAQCCAESRQNKVGGTRSGQLFVLDLLLSETSN